jgi:hypothetical protein
VYRATLAELAWRFGFTPRRRWLLKGLRAAMQAFWAAGIEEVYLAGSFCTDKPDPGDIDGYWVAPDEGVFERIDPYWTDFSLMFEPLTRKWKCRMWIEHGVEFFIHPAMEAGGGLGFPEFFRCDRNGRARGGIRVVKEGEA